jgi:hypothetical protein
MVQTLAFTYNGNSAIVWSQNAEKRGKIRSGTDKSKTEKLQFNNETHTMPL